MIKMVVVDLDGTLLNEKEEISDANKKAIEKLKTQGVRFVIATGRPEQLVKKYVDELDYNDDLIMYNGSVIGHPFKEKRMLAHKIDNHDLKEFVEYGLKNDKVIMIYTKNAIFSEHNHRVEHFLNLNKSLPERQHACFKTIKDNMDELLNTEVNKILIVEKDSKDYDETMSHFNDKTHLNFVRSQKYFIDINPKLASKGQAVEYLAKQYNINLSDVMVIGDQENDVSMLEVAGKSVVVGNASEHIKNIADHVVSSNDKDGVAEAINLYVLSEHMFN